MKIINADVEFITPVNGEIILKRLEECGRVCYKSEDKISNGTAEKFIKNIIDRGHEAVLEHCSFTVKFICDRGCYDEQTKVLTANRGWQYFKDLNDDDRFYTLDDKGDLKIVGAKSFIKYPVSQNLLHFQSTQVDLLVTPDHRMWVYDYDKRSDATRTWKFLMAEDLTNARYMFNKSSNGCSNEEQETIVIPKCRYRHSDNLLQDLVFPMNDFLWLLGLWVTDGSIGRRERTSSFQEVGKLLISQRKPKIREQLECVLQRLGISYSKTDSDYSLNCPQLRNWLKQQFLKPNDHRKTYYLKLPNWIFGLGKENLSCFLAGVVAGNGSNITNSTGYQIYTASRMFADDLLHVALLIGKTGNVRTIPPRERIFPCKNTPSHCKEQYVVSINDKKTHMFKRSSNATSITEEYYDGYVYCVELEKHHRLFVQRNGKSVWCGNCSHEIVRHRLASYCESSTRYCNFSHDKFGHEITVIKPCFLQEGQRGYDTWKDSMSAAETAYFSMLNDGYTPQEARSVLPNSLKTEVVMTANIREWRHFFKLRCSPAAHPQMREVACKLLRMCKVAMPILFDDIEWSTDYEVCKEPDCN